VRLSGGDNNKRGVTEVANKRQKKKELSKALKTIASYVEKFKRNIEKSIKADPYDTKKKLLDHVENDPANTWCWYFINKCNEEIKRKSTVQDANTAL
jgi:hypothetical protein